MRHARARLSALAVAAALTAAGCSGSSPAGPPTGEADISMPSSSAAPKAPAVHALTDPVEVIGAKGNPLTITLTGVYYHQGSKRYTASENGTYVVIAYKATAGQFPDGIPAPAGGAGWFWRGDDGTMIGSMDGTGYNAPWVGRVPEPLADQDVQPGETNLYTETLDIPAPGGTLIYSAPGTGTQTRWKLPAAATGTGYDRVIKALKILGIPAPQE